MSISSVLETTKRRFFWMVRQAERIEAERDRRTLLLLTAAQSGSQEAYDSFCKSLDEKMGVIYEFGAFQPKQMVLTEEGLDPEFDREGLRALKARHGA